MTREGKGTAKGDQRRSARARSNAQSVRRRGAVAPPCKQLLSLFRYAPAERFVSLPQFKGLESMTLEMSPDSIAGATNLIRAGALGDAVDALQIPRRPGSKPARDYRTLLHAAAAAGIFEIVKVLLDAGADPNRALVTGAPRSIVEGSWDTPLIAAINSDSTDVVAILLGAGADPNLPEHDGHPDSRHHRLLTPLICASDNPAMVSLLLKAGADPLKTDANGLTALAHARHRPEVVVLLRQAAAPKLARMRGSSVRVRKARRPFDPSVPGCREFLRLFALSPADEDRGSFLLAKAGVEEVAALLVERRESPRWEKHAEGRLVVAPWHHFAVLKLRSSPWTLALDSGLRANNGIAEDARLISDQLGTTALACIVQALWAYENGMMVDRWEPYGLDPELERSEAASEIAGLDRQLGPQMDYDALDDKLSAYGISLPHLYVRSDGFTVELTIQGIARDELERFDVVVLAEEPGHVDDRGHLPYRARAAEAPVGLKKTRQSSKQSKKPRTNQRRSRGGAGKRKGK